MVFGQLKQNGHHRPHGNPSGSQPSGGFPAHIQINFPGFTAPCAGTSQSNFACLIGKKTFHTLKTYFVWHCELKNVKGKKTQYKNSCYTQYCIPPNRFLILLWNIALGKRHKICKYVNVSFYKYCKCHTWKPFANIHKWLSKFYPAFLPHFIALDAIKVDIAFAFSHNKNQEKLKSQSVIPNLLLCGRSDCLFHSSGYRKKCWHFSFASSSSCYS